MTMTVSKKKGPETEGLGGIREGNRGDWEGLRNNWEGFKGG